jgi:hypothetical protein
LEPLGLTIPAGSSHSVGIAGLTLGGGLGILGRKYGLTCDHLLRAQIVLADGQIVECDEQENEDLFWALRGAGCGNFGVVTSLVFRTVPVPPTTIFHLVWPYTHASELIQAWQDWAPAGPDELDATLRLSASGDGDRPPLVDLFGAVLGSDTDAAELLDELIAGAGADPASASRRRVPHREAKRYLDGVGPADDWHEEAPPPPPPQASHLFTKSEFLRPPLPRETTAALVANLPRRLARGQSCEVTFTPWGGAYNRVPADATAFVHRAERFLLKHQVGVAAERADALTPAARDWLQRSWELPHAGGGAYPNFPDPDLDPWDAAYHGANLDRLLRVKPRYDPDSVFRDRGP